MTKNMFSTVGLSVTIFFFQIDYAMNPFDVLSQKVEAQYHKTGIKGKIVIIQEKTYSEQADAACNQMTEFLKEMETLHEDPTLASTKKDLTIEMRLALNICMVRQDETYKKAIKGADKEILSVEEKFVHATAQTQKKFKSLKKVDELIKKDPDRSKRADEMCMQMETLLKEVDTIAVNPSIVPFKENVKDEIQKTLAVCSARQEVLHSKITDPRALYDVKRGEGYLINACMETQEKFDLLKLDDLMSDF